MEEDFKNSGDACPQLLDLIPDERDCTMVQDAGGGRGVGGSSASEEKILELRLGLPGGGEDDSSTLSLGFFPVASKTTTTTTNLCAGNRGGLPEAAESKTQGISNSKRPFFITYSSLYPKFYLFLNLLLLGPRQQKQQGGFLQWQSRGGLPRELPHVDRYQDMEREEAQGDPGTAAGPSTSSPTRITTASVVGWPPLRSSRRTLASISIKPSVELLNEHMETESKFKDSKKSLLVKINMDGIPIGRKVDLSTHDSYEKLSLAVEELFLDLLAAKDTSKDASEKNEEAKQAFTGLLDGSGEYTLVYEDNEGDRMLVRDDPWDMFVSTVKRLRVTRSSDISALPLGAIGRKRTAEEC